LLNTLGGGSFIAIVSFTASGQTGYSGTPGDANTIFYVSTGGSGQVINQVVGLSAGNAALTVNKSGTIGGQTASFSATNKPGAAGGSPQKWVPIILDGTTYYLPAFN
jgi:hypothetical protein